MLIANVEKEEQKKVNFIKEVQAQLSPSIKILDKETGQIYPSLKPVNIVNPEVKIKKQSAPRRSFDIAYKTRILAAYDACDTPAARGALLRREGLYYSRIIAWKHQQASGKRKLAKGEKNAVRIDHLVAKVAQMEKEMAQAKVIIDIQKKVSDLLGMHIHSRETIETNLSKS